MQDPSYVKQAFGEIAARYVSTNHVLSLGIDVIWRRRVACEVAGLMPGRVLDVATGSGDLAAAVAAACPTASVTGVDFCVPMLVEARRRGLGSLVVADALRLPFADESFDVVTVGFGLRNMADWGAATREMARVLRAGGTLVALDFSLPRGRLRQRIYRIYLHRLVPRVAGVLTGNRRAYEYLGSSIENFPSGGALCELLLANGFATARVRPLTGGVASIYTARKAAG